MEDQRQLRCDWCGEPFQPPKPTGRKPRYCRQSCRQRAYEARRTRQEFEDLLAYRRRIGLDSSRDESPPVRDSSRDESERPRDSSRDESVSVQAAPVIPAPAAEPDPPAVGVVVPPGAAPRRPRPAPAIPNGVREGLDPKGWLRAFDAYGPGPDQQSPGDGTGKSANGE